MTAKPAGGFHVLVKLQAVSLQVTNELIHKNFVSFCIGFTKHSWQDFLFKFQCK